MKILIIEDDTGLNRGISFALEQEGYETVSARTLQEGDALFEKENPDAVILDLNLPDGDGVEFCRKIRQLSGAEAETAILMLTARDLETDEIMGLTSGADDYITKPFSVSVLKIRLQNVLRRKISSQEMGASPLEILTENRLQGQSYYEETGHNGKVSGISQWNAAYKLTSGDITLDTKTLRAFCGEQELNLSMTEFRLLQYFMENRNQALLKEQILQHIWDADGNFVEENTLSVNISRLRKKLNGNYIRTIQGIGYLWEEKQ